MKKIFSYMMTTVIMTALLLVSRTPVMAAGSLSVSVNKSTVKIGDTVTVTLSITDGYGAEGIIKKSSGVFGGNGDTYFTIGAGLGNTQTFSFKATETGSCKFSITLRDTTDINGNSAQMSVGSASATVVEPTNNTGGASSGNGNIADKSDDGSADSSLSSIVLSSGSLSPEFTPETKEYTTVVDYSVTSLAITAKTRNDKAVVSSVTGNDALEVGENTVTIVVTAENGSTSTYTVKVTRRTEEDPENAEHKDNWKKFDFDGQEWTIQNEIPQDILPEGFDISKKIIDGIEYNVLKSTFSDTELVYLQSDSGNGLFIYDDQQNAVFEYICIKAESHFIVVLLPNVENVPDGYSEITLSIEGKGVVTAYQPTDIVIGEEFYLLYAINDLGETGWYVYDSTDGTYMKSSILEQKVVETKSDEVSKKGFLAGNESKVLIAGVAISIFVIVLLIVHFILSMKNKKKEELLIEDEEENNYDEDSYINDEAYEYDEAEIEAETEYEMDDEIEALTDSFESEECLETIEEEEVSKTDEHQEIEKIPGLDEDVEDEEILESDEYPESDENSADAEVSESDKYSKDEETPKLDEYPEYKKAAELDEYPEHKKVAELEEYPENEEALDTDTIRAMKKESEAEVKKLASGHDTSNDIRRTVEIKTDEETLEMRLQKALEEFSQLDKDEKIEKKSDDIEFIDLD